MAYQYFKRPDGAIIASPASDSTSAVVPPECKAVTESEWRALPTHYFRMPSGLVFDISERRGGRPYKYLDNGATEISRAEFEVALASQLERQAEQRDAWIQERMEDGRDFSDFEHVAAKLEKAPRELVKDA